MNQISARAHAAIEVLKPAKPRICFRYETGHCIGVELDWGDGNLMLPADPHRWRMVTVLNDELRREDPTLIFEEQVEFDDTWMPEEVQPT
jgi:hypothetical protein